MTSFEIRDRRGGFLWISNKVFDFLAKEVQSTTFMVYLALCRLANNDTQDCYPSQNYIGDSVGVTERTVRTAIDELEKWGLIGVEKTGRSHRYSLLRTPENFSGIDSQHRKPASGQTGNLLPVSPSSSLYEQDLLEQDLILSPPSSERKNGKKKSEADPRFKPFLGVIAEFHRYLRDKKQVHLGEFVVTGADLNQLKQFLKRNPSLPRTEFKDWLNNYQKSGNVNLLKRPAQFLVRLHEYAEGPLNDFGKPLEEAQ